MEVRVIKQCKFIFVVDVSLRNVVVGDAIPLDVCGVILGSTYLYVRDVFKQMENQYDLVK